MRTFLLLALTFVAVNATQPDPELRKLLLADIIVAVKHALDHANEDLNQFVRDVIPSRCTDNNICQAAKVMTEVHLKNDPAKLIERNLHAYANITGHSSCNVPPSAQCQVKEFLRKVEACCQSLRSKHKLHPRKMK